MVAGSYTSLPVGIDEALNDEVNPACDEPSAGSLARRGVWWRFDADALPRRVILGEPGVQDSVISVWIGPDCDQLTALACADVGGGASESFALNTSGAGTLFILVSRYGASQPAPGTTVTLTLAQSATPIVPPINDACAAAVNLNSLPLPLVTSNTFAFGAATADPGVDPACDDGGLPCAAHGVWFKYTTGASGGLMQFGESDAADVVFSVWTGACDDLSSVACLDGGAADVAQWYAEPATEYRLLVSKRDFAGMGALGPADADAMITLGFNFTPGPARPINDDCGSAIEMTTFPFSSGSIATGGAAGDVPDPACDDVANLGAARGVWFALTAPATPGSLLVREIGPFDATVSLWTGECGGLIETACNSALVDVAQGWLAPLEPLARTWVLVSHQRRDVYAANEMLAVTLDLVPTPSNDDCAGASVLMADDLPKRFTVYNAYAADDSADPGACTAPEQGLHAVWWSFSPPFNGSLFVYESGSQDAACGVFTGPCDDLTNAACLANEFGAIPLSGGVPYLVQVSSQSLATPTVPLDVSFEFFPVPLPNDECLGAIDLGEAGTHFISNRGATTGSTATVACPGASTMHNDVWYRWQAPADGILAATINSHPMPVALRMAVYDGGAAGACPASGAGVLACAAGGDQQIISVTGGRAYFLRCASTSSTGFGEARLETRFSAAALGACCINGACIVTAQSLCTGQFLGVGTACAAQDASVYEYTGLGGAVPDGQSGIIEGTARFPIGVPDDFAVADVEVVAEVAHSFVGDVVMTLTHAGRTIELVTRPRRSGTLLSGSNNNLGSGATPGAFTFTNSAAQTIWDVAGSTDTSTVVPPGAYAPQSVGNTRPSFRAAFAGTSAAGLWTLTVRDLGAGSVGSVSSWRLRLTPAAPSICAPAPVTELCCRGSCCALVPSGTCPSNGSIPGVGSAVAVGDECVPQLYAGCCYADFNHANGITIDDLFLYFNAYFTGSPYAKFGGDGLVTPAIDDLFQYLNAWFAGCS